MRATGAINSFQQTLLRLTSPGVPDLYQGTELWDFSLVDPDNRRPVDFEQRRAWLSEGEAQGRAIGAIGELARGRVKLGIVQRALALRAHAHSLFEQGAYMPLKVEGEHAESVIAFARHAGSAYAVVIATRLADSLLAESNDRPAAGRCRALGRYGSRFAGSAGIARVVRLAEPERAEVGWAALVLRDALASMPVALLVEEGVPTGLTWLRAWRTES